MNTFEIRFLWPQHKNRWNEIVKYETIKKSISREKRNMEPPNLQFLLSDYLDFIFLGFLYKIGLLGRIKGYMKSKAENYYRYVFSGSVRASCDRKNRLWIIIRKDQVMLSLLKIIFCLIIFTCLRVTVLDHLKHLQVHFSHNFTLKYRFFLPKSGIWTWI